MNNVNELFQPILDSICPPVKKKTIWVLTFKTCAEQYACDFTAFWFEKPTVSELKAFGFDDSACNSLLGGEMYIDENDGRFLLQSVVPDRGYLSSDYGLVLMAEGSGLW